MLLPYTTLTYYGPAAVAALVPSAPAVMADIQATAKLGEFIPGVGATVKAKATRLRNSPAIIQSAGLVVGALPKARARLLSTIRIGLLTQDDVTGAVLEARVEGALTLKQVMRLLLAYVGGNATGLDTSPAFKSQDGTKDRLAGTITGGARTITTLDGD